MVSKSKMYIELLKNFKLQFSEKDVNNAKVIDILNKVIFELENKKLDNFELDECLYHGVKEINELIAFDGLKLTDKQQLGWHQLQELAMKRNKSDARLIDILGSFIWN